MTYEETKETRTFLQIKGYDNVVVFDVELSTLAELITVLANALNTGQIQLVQREVAVKKLKISPVEYAPITKKEEKLKDDA